MAAPEPCGGRSWPDLPSELLGLVLLRLPCHADRVRLRAVCRPWRSSARLQLQLLPPPLPCLVLRDGSFLTLPDGAVHRLSVPDDVAHLVSTGSDLLVMHDDGMLFLMNPFSSATTPLPELSAALREHYIGAALGQRIVTLMNKAVVSEHLIAFQFNSEKVTITTGQPHTVAKWSPPEQSFIVDIALFQGKLYALMDDMEKRQDGLYIIGVGDKHSIKCIPSIPRDEVEQAWLNPSSTDMYVFKRYLVAAGDRLLMVVRWINLVAILPFGTGIVDRTRRFEVFEAVDLSSGHGRWIEVDTLMGHSLFVSESCSKSLTAGAEEDCIYFMHEGIKNGMLKDPFLDSGVYNMRDGMVAPLLPETAAADHLAAHDGPWCPTWLFPTET